MVSWLRCLGDDTLPLTPAWSMYNFPTLRAWVSREVLVGEGIVMTRECVELLASSHKDTNHRWRVSALSIILNHWWTTLTTSHYSYSPKFNSWCEQNMGRGGVASVACLIGDSLPVGFGSCLSHVSWSLTRSVEIGCAVVAVWHLDWRFSYRDVWSILSAEMSIVGLSYL